MSWPDVTMPFGMVVGLPAVGHAQNYGIFPFRTPVASASKTCLMDVLRCTVPGTGDRFLLEQSVKDAEKGFCTAPMRRAEMLRLVRNEPHRLIPRCVIGSRGWSTTQQLVVNPTGLPMQTNSRYATCSGLPSRCRLS